MTKEEAIDLVFELVSAVRDYEHNNNRYYRNEYEEVRERVIAALANSPADRKGEA